MLDDQGKLINTIGSGEDSTDRKKAEMTLQREMKLRQLFMDALPCVALLRKNETREIVASSKAAVAVGAVPGKKCYSTWAQSASPCPWCFAARLWETKEVQNGQFWGLDKYLDTSWVPAADDLYLHFAFDISKQRKIEEDLKKSHDGLEKRVQERTRDLRNI